MLPRLGGIACRGMDGVVSDLDGALLAAHAAGDKAALVELYVHAADTHPGDAARFYLTHAYIFALDIGDARAPSLRARLVALGAETEC